MKILFFSVVVSILLVGSANAGLLRDLFGPNDDQRCQSYGFHHGSQGYAQCRMTLDLQRQQDHKNAIRELGDGVERAGTAFQTKPTPPTTCNTHYSHGNATTTCY
jgi:hypothetical protein